MQRRGRHTPVAGGWLHCQRGAGGPGSAPPRLGCGEGRRRRGARARGLPGRLPWSARVARNTHSGRRRLLQARNECTCHQHVATIPGSVRTFPCSRDLQQSHAINARRRCTSRPALPAGSLWGQSAMSCVCMLPHHAWQARGGCALAPWRRDRTRHASSPGCKQFLSECLTSERTASVK